MDSGLDAGLEYTLKSRILVPTPEELDQVQNLAPVQYGRSTELPDDLDPRIGQIAQEWTADATSAYDKVLAIQRHFHSDGFTYSTDVDVADDADALLTFLTQTKTGFCQQYATAMAVLVRELGIPARVAVGLPGGHPPGRRDLPRPNHGRARLGRGLLRGLRVAPVRAHARTRRPPERAAWHVPEPRRARAARRAWRVEGPSPNLSAAASPHEAGRDGGFDCGVCTTGG